MQTIQLHLCEVIPKHILLHVARHSDSEGRANAQRTLEQLDGLSIHKEQTLVGLRAATSPPARRNRHDYDAGHRRRLPGKLVMSDHRSRRGDVDVTEAYDGTGAMHDFLAKVYGRNSIDGRGGRIDSTVHYGEKFNNALWTGRQIVFGDGDGRIFNRFTSALEVIGHELAHGVTQYSVGLGYSGQPGALNEHLADVFGVLLKQYIFGQTAREASWLIGEGLFGPAVQRGAAIRSMKAPGTAYDDPILGRDPQPSHMRDYVETEEDRGGVHINSGIPNHAFYLTATDLAGPAWPVAGKIWYASMLRLRPDADFVTFARLTVAVAGELFGAGTAVQRSVIAAWKRVGIDVASPDAVLRLPAGPAGPNARTALAAPKWRTRPIAALTTNRKEQS